jgi:recombination protein RecT
MNDIVNPTQNPIAVRNENIRKGLLGVRRQIESLLADKAKSDRFMAAALVVATDKALAGCNVDSIVNSLVGVAMLDLNIDKNIGHCYLIKYGNDVQLQIGYKGFIQMLYRAGWLVKSLPVYKTDHFKISFNGWDNQIEFEPELDERDEGDKDWVVNNLRGIYVVARHGETKDEYSLFVPVSTIEKLRKVSPNQKNAVKPTNIWYDWYEEMAAAKAVKRLAKKLPIGDSRVAQAIAIDDKNDTANKVNYAKTAETGVIDAEYTKVDKTDDPINAAATQAKPKAEPAPPAPESPAPATNPTNSSSRPDWPTAIMEAGSTKDLKELESTMSEDEKKQFKDALAEQYDFLRGR